ncbi:proline rich 23A [Phyllostomus discolor]|uniref:Proline rich 23A n=1 Tax=Phyllostomus discolor TaxID=89673 RepID=A0A833ZVF8_9CHIR|nr:proline rich 23A [Phyllostomus discolor]
MELMASRLLSPSPYPAPWWGPQSEGPGSAKRRRIEESAGPDSRTAPSLQDPEADTLTSVVVLAPGCALQLPLDDVDLVLEPEPTSVLQVSLGGHTLMLVPQALLELGALQGAPREDFAVHRRFFCACVPEIAAPKAAYSQDADPGFLTCPWVDAASGSVAGFRP